MVVGVDGESRNRIRPSLNPALHIISLSKEQEAHRSTTYGFSGSMLSTANEDGQTVPRFLGWQARISTEAMEPR
jgi:hypothetical protein